jgi:phytoene dehydrogenase-like protein
MTRHDAIIIGSGPNGLAAAIVLAQAGRSVLVLEGQDTLGGGARTRELTRPGFRHDVCSAIHPLAKASPFLRELPLHEHGLEWIDPPLAAAHPLDDGAAAVLAPSIEATAATLGEDEAIYRREMSAVVALWPRIEHDLLGPFPWPPRDLLALARFGARAVRSARGYARRYRAARARALFAGLAAHAILPLERPASAAIGLVLAVAAHREGWPVCRGGSQRLVEAMASYLRTQGGEIRTGVWVKSRRDLPAAKVVLFDTAPRTMVEVMGSRLPGGYRARLRAFRHGPGVCKVDYALSAPAPWTAAACREAGTVHLGGAFDEIARSEREIFHGRHAEKPFVLVAQQSLFDSSRAPAGQHTLWAYCHVPYSSTRDASETIETQIERFAPGFRDLIVDKAVLRASDLEVYNPNYVGGDIAGGVTDLAQLFTRPVARWVPYSTPVPGVYLCSASTPPGAGVHGMCGVHAARAVLARELA